MDKEKIATAVRMILEAIGDDPERQGLLDTPKRVANMYEEVFAGMDRDPAIHCQTVFEEHHEEMVLVRDIPFSSMCEHHLVPFIGTAHVAYMPKKGRVIGLSKLARIVDDISKRPQLQERITKSVADLLMNELDAIGVMVVLEAEHMCMSIRGVKKQGAKTITSAVRGEFKTNSKSRNEVLHLINRK